jgi:nickel/cobalt transporter (NicO) family protein
MSPELLSLSLAAAWTGFVHCLCGPDHYVPFVAMSRVGAWSLRKTLVITFLCGIGHVLGSALIGFVGIALGLIVFQLEQTESVRGDIAAWGLFGFGAVYTLIGIVHALRSDLRRSGVEQIAATDSTGIRANALSSAKEQNANPLSEESNNPYSSSQTEMNSPAVASPSPAIVANKTMTPWILFVVFLFGPCEPLIPYLMVPAAKANMWGVAWVTLLFGVTTLATMTTLVALIYRGTLAMQFNSLQRWGHAVAGLVVLVCGAAMLSGL